MKFDAAYENYSVNMTSEEAQKEFVDAFILRLLSEKKLWKIAHANIVDSAVNITDGRAMLDKLSSPLMLENINTIFEKQPGSAGNMADHCTGRYSGKRTYCGFLLCSY